ncbi:hypothetical protein FB451DRAFT_1176465 [Mycena latifolia]|nr:hypothetical protein FB451DRAFT_1176465 [Mycena latifolia]
MRECIGNISVVPIARNLPSTVEAKQCHLDHVIKKVLHCWGLTNQEKESAFETTRVCTVDMTRHGQNTLYQLGHVFHATYILTHFKNKLTINEMQEVITAMPGTLGPGPTTSKHPQTGTIRGASTQSKEKEEEQCNEKEQSQLNVKWLRRLVQLPTLHVRPCVPPSCKAKCDPNLLCQFLNLHLLQLQFFPGAVILECFSDLCETWMSFLASPQANECYASDLSEYSSESSKRLITLSKVLNPSRIEESLMKYFKVKSIVHEAKDAGSSELGEGEALLALLDGHIQVPKDGGWDENCRARWKPNYELKIPEDQMPASIGVEIAQGSDGTPAPPEVGKVEWNAEILVRDFLTAGIEALELIKRIYEDKVGS